MQIRSARLLQLTLSPIPTYGDDQLQKEQINQLTSDVARWENEGGTPSQSKSQKAISWFVPPIVIPALIIVLIVARIANVIYT